MLVLRGYKLRTKGENRGTLTRNRKAVPWRGTLLKTMVKLALRRGEAPRRMPRRLPRRRPRPRPRPSPAISLNYHMMTAEKWIQVMRKQAHCNNASFQPKTNEMIFAPPRQSAPILFLDQNLELARSWEPKSARSTALF